MGQRAAERITKSRLALSKVRLPSTKVSSQIPRISHDLHADATLHRLSLPLTHGLSFHLRLPKVAKSLPGLAGGAMFGALLGYRIG